ncbi:MAG: substrate-binding domain-containing protein [Anaerolineaceae bacterium]|nr:substrate-binding domain-containing protein [Anaerolineaceae bacterium]
MSHHRAIGLITTFISGRFYEQIMSGVQEVAWKNQVDILVINSTPDQVALSGVSQQRVDGWMVLTYPSGLELLAQQGKPIVTISCRLPGQTYPAVLPDNRQGTETILENLLSQGHQHIAFVGDTSIGDIQERYQTYQEVLNRHHIPYDPQLVLHIDSPLSDQGELAARRLAASRVPCTAVVAGNDWTAIGLMREFQEQGYRIPEDMAIVGFDDIPESQTTTPPLSTVRQRSDQLGRTATSLLLEQIGGKAAEPTVHYIPTTFVQRESSGSNLLSRINQWKNPQISTGSLWQASLSKELVRVLLPALSLESNPSAAQVWPEVDKLVQLLWTMVETDEPKEIDDSLLKTIFSSYPILNASPEILVEMLQVLNAAGLVLSETNEEPQKAKQRLQAFCDQLTIEVIRSYRRRQNISQRTMSEIIQSQYIVSQLLIKNPPQQVDWLRETDMFSGCLGLWSPSGDDDPPILSVAGCYQQEGSCAVRVGKSYIPSLFPPLDKLPSSSAKNGTTTCLVLPVRSIDHDWGMLAVSGPLISKDPWLEDNTINILEIYCGFLGITLEKEALQESLRHTKENEQMLSDKLNEIKP